MLPGCRLSLAGMDGVFNQVGKDHDQIRIQRRLKWHVDFGRYGNAELSGFLDIDREGRVEQRV